MTTILNIITIDASEEEKRWNIFTGVVADMHALKLLHFFMEHAVTVIIHDKVTVANHKFIYSIPYIHS